jgi:hypothetical protein
MKIVCISNVLDDEILEDLIVGEVYDAIEDPRYTYNDVYHLVNDDPNEYIFYSVKLFKRLDEIREEKLKEIGI